LKASELPAIVFAMNAGGDARFPATIRLKHRADLGRVYRSGRARSGALFSLRFLAREGEGRLGITIPRRWGSAVERNRVKRLLREAFRRHRAEFAGVDLVVQPYESCKGRRADEVERALVEEFRAAAPGEVEDE